MSNYAISLKRTSLLLAALAFTAVLLVANLSFLGLEKVGAAQLTTRNLSLTSSLAGTQTSGAANNETNGSDSTHAFTFDPGSAHTIRSMRFQYCTTAIGSCTAPTNVSVESGTAITVQQLEGVNFSNLYAIDATVSDDDELCIDNTTGNAVTAGSSQTITVSFDDIRNPDTVATFFVRITTYSAVDCATAVDTGTVASAITNGIAITSRVVETLGFSTTTDDAGEVAEGASCAALGGSTSSITIGDATDGALSITQAYDEYSAFRLYTNAANGVVVQYEGSTLTKGSDDINAAGGTAVASTVGSEQFGLAVDANGTTGPLFDGDNGGFGGAGQLALGADYDGGDGTITNGGTATFAFVADTKTQMASATQFVTCDTAAVRYIGNISPLTPAGTYTTTVVYFAVPTY